VIDRRKEVMTDPQANLPTAMLMLAVAARMIREEI